jgi:hypothetical protein
LLKESIIFKENIHGYLGKIDRVGYFNALILTSSYLIFRQNYLTSATNLKITQIVSYKVKSPMFSKVKNQVILTINLGPKEINIPFKTKMANEWESALSSIGIKKIT